MVTLKKIGRYTNCETLEITGLSTDEKPVMSINGTPIINGSVFDEIDTGKEYKYDEDNDGWIEQFKAGNSGGNISLDYTAITNKPHINNVELEGNKTLEDLGIQPKGEYIIKETDPTVPAWAKQPNKPVYTASEVHALPDTINVMRNPKKVIFTGAVNGEYDGSVERTFNIPKYNLPQAKEKSLGGIKAKEKTNETVEVAIDTATGKLFVPTYPIFTGKNLEIDKTLTVEDNAADAKAVGDALKSKIGLSALNPYIKTADANEKYALKTDIPGKGVAVADASDTDVKDKFNALLISLRDAGIIAS